MRFMNANGVNIHFADEGNPNGIPIVFANSLGTDFRLWDAVIAELPGNLRLIRCDKRGHGLSGLPPGPCSMDALAADTAALLDQLGVRGCVFVGLSIGGMIAQALALSRPDLVKAAVLSNTAAKIGDREMWETRISAVRAGGISAIAPGIIERWFSETFRTARPAETQGWTAMLSRTTAAGYIACSAAIMETDLTREAGSIRQPVCVIGASEDGATPPGLVRATAELIAGAHYHEIEGAGHLPCVEAPVRYAELLRRFVNEVT